MFQNFCEWLVGFKQGFDFSSMLKNQVRVSRNFLLCMHMCETQIWHGFVVVWNANMALNTNMANVYNRSSILQVQHSPSFAVASHMVALSLPRERYTVSLPLVRARGRHKTSIRTTAEFYVHWFRGVEVWFQLWCWVRVLMLLMGWGLNAPDGKPPW